jgi:hypothetical protein
LLVLALAVLLIQELGMAMPRAIAVAEELAKNEGRYTVREGFSLNLDLSSFQARLLEKLENAVEITPVPKRGRPSLNKTGRLD